MEESHLVKLVRPFVGGKRAEITSTPKMFFLDNGLRNFLFGGFTAVNQRADCGALVENLVFAELDSDRGNDSLRKTKYIVNLKPQYFYLVSIGRRFEFRIEYPDNMQFQLVEDLVPLV